ncbi:MAG: hypothetical protein QXP31_10340 [Pyrobaculum sp.]
MKWVDEWGERLYFRRGVFVLVKKEGKVEIPPPQVDSIVVAVPGVAVSAKALVKAAEFGIDVVLMPGWRPAARLVPAARQWSCG